MGHTPVQQLVIMQHVIGTGINLQVRKMVLGGINDAVNIVTVAYGDDQQSGLFGPGRMQQLLAADITVKYLEAELTYAGLATLTELTGPTVMVDIGGASTEVVVGDGPKVIDAVSIRLGSGRLTDTWIVNDPPSWAEVAAARVAAADRTAPLGLSRHAGSRLIVSGGTGNYLSAYLGGESALTVPDIDLALSRMARLPSDELANVIDAPRERARVLPAGVAIILAVADRVRPATIETMQSGLRIGLLEAAAKGTLR